MEARKKTKEPTPQITVLEYTREARPWQTNEVLHLFPPSIWLIYCLTVRLCGAFYPHKPPANHLEPLNLPTSRWFGCNQPNRYHKMDYTDNHLRFSAGPPPLSPSRSSPTSIFPGFLGFAPPFPSATPFGETPASSTLPSPPRSQEQQQQALPISQSRQIHRNRISYSCHACRRRKVKCDRQHPICGNCTRASDVCIYDDHSNKKKGSKSGVQQPQSITNPPRTKRQRTREDSEDWETGEGYPAVAITSNTNGPESTSPSSQEKQGDLEARMNKLAEVVDKWYRDAYGQGIIPPPRKQALGIAGTDGSDTKSTFEGSLGQIPTAKDALSQEQGILDNMRRLTHSISGVSGASGSPDRSIACSSVSSPYSPRSQKTVTTPGSSVSGHSQQVPALEDTNGATHPPKERGESAMKLLNQEIEAARAGGAGDGIDDLGLGHLSIQGRGRSRYVGSSFWASISHEVILYKQFQLHSLLLHKHLADCLLTIYSRSPSLMRFYAPTNHLTRGLLLILQQKR